MTLRDIQIAGLILAVFGVLFSVDYVRAKSRPAKIKASILLLGWLVLAIGFALYWGIEGASILRGR